MIIDIAAIDKLDKKISHILKYILMPGAVCLVFMIILITVNSCMRYIFSSPLPGAKEISEFMLCIFALSGLIYTEHAKGNIRVTMFERFLSKKLRLIMAIVYNCLSLVIMLFLLWSVFLSGIEEFYLGTKSDFLSIPIYPFKLLLSAGVFLLCLRLLLSFAKSFAELKSMLKSI